MEQILIVEDDKILNLGLQACLKECQYDVCGVMNGGEALDTIMKRHVDLVILDVNLPDMDGFSLCRKIKAAKELPVVFLTARDEDEDMLKGFDIGAEDYITKPFNIDVFQRRVTAILKRCKNQSVNQYFYNGFSIDFDKKKAVQNGEVINFTPTEFRILELMVVNRGHVLMKEVLMQDLWDKNGKWVDEHTLAVNISRIRAKLKEPEREMIKTVFGIGYMWNVNIESEYEN